MMRSRKDITNYATTSKTPVGCKSFGAVQSGRKTPGSTAKPKTPSSTSKALRNLTPSRNHSFLEKQHTKSASKQGQNGDRYIPVRSETNMELAQYLILRNSSSQDTSSLSPRKVEQQAMLGELLNGGVTGPNRCESAMNFSIFGFKERPPAAPMGQTSQHQVIFASSASSCRKTIRHIPNEPERILDAPEIVDDFYLHVTDWGTNRLLAAGLANQLYIWNPSSGEIDNLASLPGADEYYCAVAWGAGNYLAVSDQSGTIRLYDVEKEALLRTLTGHADRVACLAWKGHELTSGCRDGSIFNHDVRMRQHHTSSFMAHRQEVCGLEWSNGDQWLASGGNDNTVYVWQPGTEEPLHEFTEHQAAVKAIAWCPWQRSMLASGGGTADRQIKLWNVQNGTCLETTDTSSQICSLLWSEEYKEIISGHGYPNYQLSVWKYPTMTKIADLTGHTGRILHLCMSPCKEMVLSASADESLRLWKCFAVDPATKKRTARAQAKAAANRHPPGTTLPRALLR